MASNMWRTAKFTLILLLVHLFGVLGKSHVVKLGEENWEEMLSKEWMVEFYAPWCPACKALQPVWEKFSLLDGKLGIKVGQIDVTTSPGLSGRFMVTALPTIFHVSNGEFRQYRGARDEEGFISFIREEKWKLIDAIPSWKSPGSIQMSVVSYFFKLSQILRSVHNNLMEEYGLPTWGSYFIFAVATIFIGALLGLVLVCIIDLIYPPSKATSIPLGDKDKSDSLESDNQASGDEEVEEDLVDEGAEGAEGAEDGNPDSEAEQKESEGSPNVRKRKPRKDD